VLAAAAASTAVRPVLTGVWITGNVFLTLTAAVWALAHPRAIWGARTVLLRGALLATLALVLVLCARADAFLASVAGVAAAPSSGLVLVLPLVLGPLLFPFLLLFGWLGAALGAFRQRRHVVPALRETAAAVGAGAWWAATLAALLAATFLPAGMRAAVPVLIGGVPVLSVGLAALGRRSGWHVPGALRNRVLSAARVFVWRGRWRGGGGRMRTLDLRGAVLGLVAGAAALALAQVQLLRPLQAAAFVSMTHLANLRNELWTQFGVEIGQTPPRTIGDRVVVLEMDAPVLRGALTTGSETALQARVLRKLDAWGAARVVLPLPALDPAVVADAPARGGAGRRGTPAPAADDVARSVHDLPQLLAAMKAAAAPGRVVLAVPRLPNGLLRLRAEDGKPATPAPVPPPVARDVDRLRRAAAAAGGVELGALGTASLPTVPTAPGAGGERPVPLLLLAAAHGRAPTARPVRGSSDRVEIAGKSFPLAAPGQILVDFRGARTDGDDGLPRVTYSAVLREEMVPRPHGGPMSDRPEWLVPAEFFRGRIVFLDALTPRVRETPIGAMTEMETLAFATETLLAGQAVRRPPAALAALGTLLLAMLVGHLSVGRAPLDALWRVSIPVFGAVAFALAETTSGGAWVDPIVPVLAAGFAFLLVNQFTFGLERDERERNRALVRRFVAPQVVEEMLDDPQGKLGLGGVRRQVCVLFADVRDFTGFAERHTPEQVIAAVNRYMGALTEALYAHEGRLDKFTGDGLMALFVVDRPGEAAAREVVSRAVRAALAMRDVAEETSAQLRAEGLVPLPIGIGLHYGEAVVGLVGNPVHQVNYTALGHTVVVSARLQSIAAGGDVVISQAVHDLTAGAFAVEAGAPVQVKGISAPVRPYRVLAPEGAARAAAAAAPPP
jgi:class 3 adenylate cyclase